MYTIVLHPRTVKLSEKVDTVDHVLKHVTHIAIAIYLERLRLCAYLLLYARNNISSLVK